MLSLPSAESHPEKVHLSSSLIIAELNKKEKQELDTAPLACVV